MRTSQKGRAIIKKYEGFREYAYPDPASALYRAAPKLLWGLTSYEAILSQLSPEKRNQLQSLSGSPWTIGYGFTKGVKPGMQMTMAQAEARLITELLEYEQGVASSLQVEPPQNEFDAMVSLAWNIGVPRFRTSSVVKAHNRGDKASAGRAFGLWNKANGREMPGLVARRAGEAKLYLTPDPKALPPETPEAPVEMPQSVDAERPMTSSSINRASVVAGGTATVAAVGETLNTINGVKYGVESLGSWLVPVALVAVIALCGYIIYERYQQRKNGWA